MPSLLAQCVPQYMLPFGRYCGSGSAHIWVQVDGALEAVEGHGPAALRNAHGPVVIVAGNVTACHGGPPGTTRVDLAHSIPAPAKAPAAVTGAHATNGKGRRAPDRQALSAAMTVRRA